MDIASEIGMGITNGDFGHLEAKEHLSTFSTLRKIFDLGNSDFNHEMECDT